MIFFFDLLYTSLKDKYLFLRNIRFYSLCRFVIRCLANLIIPIYYILTKRNKNYSLQECKNHDSRIIVSLTSFPERINRLWIVIESLLRQQNKPDMIILWLSVDQFSSIQQVPIELIKLQKRGLVIRLCQDDIRAHKKYYYAVKEFYNDYIITVDDDVFYNSNLLSNLIKTRYEFPLAVCCNHAAKIKLKDGDITTYSSWEDVRTKQNPSSEIMAIGVGGVLYPPNALHNDAFNIDILKNYCLMSDDIWLNIMERLNGTLVAKTSFDSKYIPIMYRKNINLFSINIGQGLNDKQLRSMREYYKYNKGIDPYQDIISK